MTKKYAVSTTFDELSKEGYEALKTAIKEKASKRGAWAANRVKAWEMLHGEDYAAIARKLCALYGVRISNAALRRGKQGLEGSARDAMNYLVHREFEERSRQLRTWEAFQRRQDTAKAAKKFDIRPFSG